MSNTKTIKIPDGYKLMPTRMTEDQLRAVVPYHYFIESVEKNRRAEYDAFIKATPDTQLEYVNEFETLMNEVANWIEALPLGEGIADGACAILHKIEQALGTSGPDTHSTRRMRRILNAQGATQC
ncbi:hypothetical protein pf16_182 [Pseudomonas phage pf16]|uniref:Uncharacterized protein n=1 Tax=Pseudomonas phage pf16 TaxID=1815630 RepID=A0A1S5R449_9CAUD|nr:hypothetical protein FDG98_gp116 [Pseudomonas phage pf16]AND75105.1 hypothetical protein pf16_182 [Pseudomonas phage pf16]